MADSPPMVMRSVYLPEEMDLRLRQVAFFMHRSKADLIRAFVARGLSSVPSNIGSLGAHEREHAVARILSDRQGESASEQSAYDTDVNRVAEASEQSTAEVSEQSTVETSEQSTDVAGSRRKRMQAAE